MGLLDRIIYRNKSSNAEKANKVEKHRLFSPRELEAKKLKRVMRAVGATQIENPTEVIKRRHLTGLSLPGAAAVPARLPLNLIRGSLRNLDPWWHADAVRRHYRDDELTEDRRVANTHKFLVRTETRNIVLLDGQKIKTIRKVYYDKQSKLHSKELFMQDESGQIFDYNTISSKLLSLDGIESVSIEQNKDIIVTEGYPAAEALRKRGVDAVAIIGGTFDLPSERALDPLLKAKHIYLWPDNDSAGAFLMSGVARKLTDMGAREEQIKLIIWRDGPRKGDACDYKGDDNMLAALLDDAVIWSPALRMATNSIQYLSVPRTLPKLRLDDHSQPPMPELLRVVNSSGVSAEINDMVSQFVDDESLSDEAKALLQSLVNSASEDEG